MELEIIEFFTDDFDEAIRFALLSSIELESQIYLLVTEEETLDEEEWTIYVFKEVEIGEDEVAYDLVEDDAELEVVLPLLQEEYEKNE